MKRFELIGALLALGGMSGGIAPEYMMKVRASPDTKQTYSKPAPKRKRRRKGKVTGDDFRYLRTINTLKRDHRGVAGARRKATKRKNIRAHSSKKRRAA